MGDAAGCEMNVGGWRGPGCVGLGRGFGWTDGKGGGRPSWTGVGEEVGLAVA